MIDIPVEVWKKKREAGLSNRREGLSNFWLRLIYICHLFFFVSMEICDPRNNITMCPLCDQACSYWKLVTACGTARASHLFDNAATVFFSVFMALWGKYKYIGNNQNTCRPTNKACAAKDR